jgi:methylglyoxal synthase
MSAETNNMKKMNIVIAANETNKTALIEWSYANKNILEQHNIIAPGKSAVLLKGVLLVPVLQLSPVTTGGIAELEKMVEENEVDVLLFFPSLQDQDVVADKFRNLLTLASEKDILIAFNTTTANLVLQSLANSNEVDMEIATLKALS